MPSQTLRQIPGRQHHLPGWAPAIRVAQPADGLGEHQDVSSPVANPAQASIIARRFSNKSPRR